MNPLKMSPDYSFDPFLVTGVTVTDAALSAGRKTNENISHHR